MVASNEHDIMLTYKPFHLREDITLHLHTDGVVDLTQVTLLVVDIIIADIKDQTVKAPWLQGAQFGLALCHICLGQKNQILLVLLEGVKANIPGGQLSFVSGKAATLNAPPATVWVSTGKDGGSCKHRIRWYRSQQGLLFLDAEAFRKHWPDYIHPGIPTHAIKEPDKEPLPWAADSSGSRPQELCRGTWMFEITFRIGLNKESDSMVQGIEPVSDSRLKLRE